MTLSAQEAALIRQYTPSPAAASGGAVLDLVPAIERYVDLLIQWNARINLTAVRSQSDVVSRHFVDSLAIVPWIPSDAKTLVDVGSGAGFPGAVIALARPDTHVTLVESNHKKTAFLEEIRRLLPIANLRIESVRAEDMASRVERGALPPFDLAMSRATLDIPVWLQLGARLVRSGGLVLGLEGAERHKNLPPTATRHEYEIDRVPKAVVTFHVEHPPAPTP